MGTNRKYINRVLHQFQLVIKWQQSIVSSKITLQKILMRLRESNSRPQHYYQLSKGLRFPKYNAHRSQLLLYIALSSVFKNRKLHARYRVNNYHFPIRIQSLGFGEHSLVLLESFLQHGNRQPETKNDGSVKYILQILSLPITNNLKNTQI